MSQRKRRERDKGGEGRNKVKEKDTKETVPSIISVGGRITPPPTTKALDMYSQCVAYTNTMYIWVIIWYNVKIMEECMIGRT
jgi:hypothetical protein